MHEAVDIFRFSPGLVYQSFRPLGDRDARIIRRRQLFPDEYLIPLFIDHHKVCERAADIDSNTDAFAHFFSYMFVRLLSCGIC